MNLLDFWKDKNSGTNPTGLDAIKAKYAEQVKDLKGTDAEIAEQKKVLDDLMNEEIAALTPAQEVTVEFTAPKFRYKGVEYVSADVEAAAAKGNKQAEALINKLIDIGSSIVKIVNK